MNEPKISPEERRRPFADALAAAMHARTVTQRQLADELGTTQSAVSAWIQCHSEPERETVFRIEKILDLSPGFLSQHLGYLPPEAAKKAPPCTFEQALMADPLLEDSHKAGLLASYKAFTAARRRR